MIHFWNIVFLKMPRGNSGFWIQSGSVWQISLVRRDRKWSKKHGFISEFCDPITLLLGNLIYKLLLFLRKCCRMPQKWMPKKGSKTHCHQSTRNCGCWRWSQSIKSSEFSRVCCLTERKCHDSHVIKVLSGGSLDNCSQNVVIFLMFCSKKARSISKLVKNTTFCKSWFLNRERPPKHC